MKPSDSRRGFLGTLMTLFGKYRQVILYLFFGFLTFLVSMGSYTLCYRVLGMDVLIANVVSWIFAVLFAFFTNRKWVFDGDKGNGGSLMKQLISFCGGRLFTLGVEELILAVFVNALKFDGVVVKVVAQVIVVLSNYFISKFWVFRKSGDGK